MNDTPTPETDALDVSRRQINISAYFSMRSYARKLECELDEAREYADTLAQGLPDGMLPKDVEVLRTANLGLATELNDAQNEIIGWKNKWDCAIEMAARAECNLDEMTLRWERTNDALFAERALADRLAKQLDDCLLSQEDIGHVMIALEAWKEARK